MPLDKTRTHGRNRTLTQKLLRMRAVHWKYSESHGHCNIWLFPFRVHLRGEKDKNNMVKSFNYF